MKKLVVFGDSFANYSWHGENETIDKSWAIGLAKKLDIPIINYGIAGSSVIYSFHKFWEYFKSDQYCEEDIIKFEKLQEDFEQVLKNIGIDDIIHDEKVDLSFDACFCCGCECATEKAYHCNYQYPFYPV